MELQKEVKQSSEFAGLEKAIWLLRAYLKKISCLNKKMQLVN